MRLFGLTVGHNEADRYLVSMLTHYQDIFDDHFFYDDRSTDETAAIAHEFNCTTEIRPADYPSFIQNEGAFREMAWEAFERKVNPRPGDWVLVNDCDEVLVSQYGTDAFTIRQIVERTILAAGTKVAINLNIPEVFGFDEELAPLVRTDRLWGTIHAPRLFAYRPGGTYRHGEMGVPAVPSYVMAGPWFSTDALALMHFGYADKGDQEVKYARYNGRTGHSNMHVESIAYEDKTLVGWDWPYPQMARSSWE